MSNNLLFIENNDIYTTSMIIADELERKHQSITRLIQENETSFKKFGVVRFEIDKPIKGSKGGRPEKYYYVNEKQFLLLITLLRVKRNEYDKVLDLKERFVNEFFIMKDKLNNLAKEKINYKEWKEKRLKGIVARNKETETIKKFVEYAIEQGSNGYKNNPSLAYSNITRMGNKALFENYTLIKKQTKDNDSFRNTLNCKQLDEIKQVDEIVEKYLKEGLEQGLDYKKIYNLVKKNVEDFAKIKGKSIIEITNKKLLK
jgi:phage regulator Rha-like protein